MRSSKRRHPQIMKAAHMHYIGCGHPDVLSSLVFVRTAPELEEGSLVSSLALFTVTRCGDSEARIDLVHTRFDPMQDRDAIIADVCRAIPDGTPLLVRQRYHEYLPDFSGELQAALPLLDNGRLACALPGTTLLPLCSSDEEIYASGEAAGLDMPGPDSTPRKCNRRAPLETMALWSIYVRGFCKEREARELIAAFGAWYLLERVKPIPSR